MSAIVLSASSADALQQAADRLAAGELVVIPTDTVYGLAAALSHPAAIARIFQVKRRPSDRPIALLVDRIDDVAAVAASIPPIARVLMDRFWPGGLTLALPRRPEVPDVVTAGGPTVAVRMPNHPVPRALVRLLGAPLPTTSANVSGRPSPRDARQAEAELGEAVSLILDGGPALGGVDSTVVDVTTAEPTVLRVGAVPVDALDAALGARVRVR